MALAGTIFTYADQHALTWNTLTAPRFWTLLIVSLILVGVGCGWVLGQVLWIFTRGSEHRQE
jgi:hypothetical protein